MISLLKPCVRASGWAGSAPLAICERGGFITTRFGRTAWSTYLGREPSELFRQVCAYRRGAHTTSRDQSYGQFGHRVAVRHFEHENDIILTSRHIAADEPTAQFRDLALKGFVLRGHTFDRFRALIGPIQKADEKHGSPRTLRRSQRIRRHRVGHDRMLLYQPVGLRACTLINEENTPAAL